MLPGSLLQHIWALQVKTDFPPRSWQLPYFFSHLKSLSLLLLVLLLLQIIVLRQSEGWSARGSSPGKAAPLTPAQFCLDQGGDQSFLSHITGGHPPRCGAGADLMGRGLSASICLFAWKVSRDPEMPLPSQRIVCKSRRENGVQGSLQKSVGP